MDEFSWN